MLGDRIIHRIWGKSAVLPKGKRLREYESGRPNAPINGGKFEWRIADNMK